MRYANRILALTLLLAAGSAVYAQPAADAPRPCPDCAARRKDPESQSTHTFYLKYAIQQSDINEIGAMLRNSFPDDRIFVVTSQTAIIMHAIPEDIALAQKLIDNLDRQKKTWRLTYTLTEVDGDKRLGTQHYSMDLVDGQQTTLQQQSRVPIATGSYSAGVQTSFSYQDIGITFDAKLTPQGSGASLISNIEQNSLADGYAGNPPAPVVTRHSSLKGAYLLAPGKPLILGAMDIPGSTHHLEVEALIEPLP